MAVRLLGKQSLQLLLYKNVKLLAPIYSCFKNTKFRSPDLLKVQYSNAAYEGDGKTKASILNTEIELGLMVTSFSQFGFRLNNDMVIMGPMAIFPRSVLSWNVNSHADINEKSLSIFYTLEPKIDVLVLGIGDQQVTPAFSKRVMEFMKKYQINIEVLRTEQACTTFNFLNAENRMVAAALIPPTQFSFNENDVLQTKLKKKELYEVD